MKKLFMYHIPGKGETLKMQKTRYKKINVF